MIFYFFRSFLNSSFFSFFPYSLFLFFLICPSLSPSYSPSLSSSNFIFSFYFFFLFIFIFFSFFFICHFFIFLSIFSTLIDKRSLPAIDMSFVISATAAAAMENFQQMKDIINRMVLKYGTKAVRYSLIVFGENPVIQHR